MLPLVLIVRVIFTRCLRVLNVFIVLRSSGSSILLPLLAIRGNLPVLLVFLLLAIVLLGRLLLAAPRCGARLDTTLLLLHFCTLLRLCIIELAPPIFLRLHPLLAFLKSAIPKGKGFGRFIILEVVVLRSCRYLRPRWSHRLPHVVVLSNLVLRIDLVYL